MIRRGPLVLGIAAGAGLFVYWQGGKIVQALSGGALDDAIWGMTGVSMSNWQNDLNDPGRGGPYRDAIAAAELRNGIPPLMLARQLWQESRFRPDIISCKTGSSAGAQGIAQIIPRWNPGVNPCDPMAAIDYAARKMAGLYRMFGTWERALQAYNWGEGNLSNYLAGKISTMPAETRNYSAEILADVDTATGRAYA